MATTGYTYGDGRVSVYDPAINSTYVTGLWRNCPLWEQVFDPRVGALWDYSGIKYDASNEWTLTQATTGTAAIATTTTGCLLVDAGASTQHQGVNLQALKAGFLPAANKSLWWEADFSVSAAAPPVTKLQLYLGLAASDTTIFASGAQTTNNRLGFQVTTTLNLGAVSTADKAGAGATGTGATLADATRTQFGGFFDGVADTYQAFVNGVAVGTAFATANIPKLIVYPSVVVQSDGVDRPTMLLRSFRVFQLR